MVKTLQIRQAEASLQDAQAIQRIEHGSLGDSTYDAQYMLRLLQLAGQYSYLAWVGGEAAGFCSCFETSFALGQRLEIDLLGVLPQYRNRGIAALLIRTACTEASQRGIHEFRAAVADDNVASQRAFGRAGLRRSELAVDLLVYRLQDRRPVSSLPPPLLLRLIPTAPTLSPVDVSSPLRAQLLQGDSIMADADCLVIQTVIYTGIWLERLQGSEEHIIHLMRALLGWAAAHKLDEVGILCTAFACPEAGHVNALWRAGFESLGKYYIYS
ncbi:MAG: GNAT family N-acetyltransferase [Chloroflexi bacterium]|nr:GNAT family N-acetyltransferase [Chloroflexota bacterium]